MTTASSTTARLTSRLSGATGQLIDVHSPATGDLLGSMPQYLATDLPEVFARARRAQVDWARYSPQSRARLLSAFGAELNRRSDDVSDVLQLETGKSRADTVVELGESVLITSYHCRTAPSLLNPRSIPAILPIAVSAKELRHPKGVVTVITPWNFPLAMAADDAVPALLAGNAVVLKPDNQTAYSALLMAEILRSIGLPDNVFQVVTGTPNGLGETLITSADYVAFTGSTASGRKVAATAGAALIGCSLELGGKNPMVVLDDADLDRAVGSIPRGCYLNSGQTCMSFERAYVHSSIFDEFVQLAVARTKELVFSVGTLDYTGDIGSLTTAAALERVKGYVDDAVARGATILCGGNHRPDIGPYYFEPTVLTDVPAAARMSRDEVFGPVLAIYPFDGDAAAVEAANDTEFGLVASVWTQDRARGERIAAQIAAGSVCINDAYTVAFGSHAAPAGGMKASGLGRRHGEEGLLRYVERQTIADQRIPVITSQFGLSNAMYPKFMIQAMRLLRHLGR